LDTTKSGYRSAELDPTCRKSALGKTCVMNSSRRRPGGSVGRFRAGKDRKSRALDEAAGFYSVYSVKRRFGASTVFSVVRSGQNASPWPHLFSIFKCIPSSQAGRRGFDPRLPLHVFNNLRRSEKHALLRGCSFGHCKEDNISPMQRPKGRSKAIRRFTRGCRPWIQP
jgi:hypothetical protein